MAYDTIIGNTMWDDPQTRAYLNQRSATSGTVQNNPAILENIIKGKLSAATDEMYRRKALAYQQYRDRLALELMDDEANAKSMASGIGGVSSMGATLLGLYGKKPLTGTD